MRSLDMNNKPSHAHRIKTRPKNLLVFKGLTLWIWDTFANSEDPYEMQHNAAFHLGLHC